MEYMVVYSSKTGNTKKLAAEIFAELPGTSKDMQKLSEFSGKDADTYLVGFWTDRGGCDMEVADFLSELHGKRVILFGTCGMGRDRSYYKRIENQVRVWIPEDNQYLGAFLCQGKMPMQVRDKYEQILRSGTDEDSTRKMMRNFDEALLHPDNQDLWDAREFVKMLLQQEETK